MPELSPAVGQSQSLLPDQKQQARRRRLRKFQDRASFFGVATAGLAVVGALALIFVYLFLEVAPLLRGASVNVQETYGSPASSIQDPAEHLVLERYEQIAASFNRTGAVNFFRVGMSREIVSQHQVPVPPEAGFSSLAAGESAQGLVAYGFDNGQVSLVRHDYDLSYPNDQRLVTPKLEHPLGESPLTIDEQGRALSTLAVQDSARGVQIGAITEDNRILLAIFDQQTNILTGETQVSSKVHTLPALPDGHQGRHMLIDKSGRHMVIADHQGQLHYMDISRPAQSTLNEPVSTKGEVTAMAFLVGTDSLIVGTGQGQITQWFPVRDERNQYALKPVRDFESLPGAITDLTPEYSRKGFWAADDQGHVGVYHGTTDQTLLTTELVSGPISQLAISPINSRLIALDERQQVSLADVWNKHPDVSFSSLWEKVWYEGRDEPEYVWQASGARNDFEPKMSLVPLTLGTLKAAFYAMIFAIPLAVMGAIYTAYFMTPKLRGLVKPSIEIMEALPTVILGFLAGLWLAPFLENHLPAVFSLLMLLPLTMLLVGFAWSRLPRAVRMAVPEGWEAAILVLPLLLVGWLSIAISPQLEVLFFDGSMRQWLTNQGINYDQRNALVVGFAMGFAVIPTIFSIAEDAVFNVPRHLTQGSLALGATRWQTVVGVILPTASPGIFSAVMMGFGRAVGETMIVLMATGNSPVLNFNLFEGMRTLSANVAVEIPETAIDSTHYRVLFLAALVLLAMTFIVNTVAEIVRQRLRKRYSNL